MIDSCNRKKAGFMVESHTYFFCSECELCNPAVSVCADVSYLLWLMVFFFMLPSNVFILWHHAIGTSLYCLSLFYSQCPSVDVLMYSSTWSIFLYCASSTGQHLFIHVFNCYYYCGNGLVFAIFPVLHCSCT